MARDDCDWFVDRMASGTRPPDSAVKLLLIDSAILGQYQNK